MKNIEICFLIANLTYRNLRLESHPSMLYAPCHIYNFVLDFSIYIIWKVKSSFLSCDRLCCPLLIYFNNKSRSQKSSSEQERTQLNC
jgi:hypothetical protein